MDNLQLQSGKISLSALFQTHTYIHIHTHTQTHAHTHTHTPRTRIHMHTHKSDVIVIGVMVECIPITVRLHLMRPNYCQILTAVCPLFIIGLLYDDLHPSHSRQTAYKNFGCWVTTNNIYYRNASANTTTTNTTTNRKITLDRLA